MLNICSSLLRSFNTLQIYDTGGRIINVNKNKFIPTGPGDRRPRSIERRRRPIRVSFPFASSSSNRSNLSLGDGMGGIRSDSDLDTISLDSGGRGV